MFLFTSGNFRSSAWQFLHDEGTWYGTYGNSYRSFLSQEGYLGAKLNS